MRVSRRSVGGVAPLVDVSVVNIIIPPGLQTWNGTRLKTRGVSAHVVEPSPARWLENGDALANIDTSTNKVVSTSPIGQAPQAIAYVPNAVPDGDGKEGLDALGVAGEVTHLALHMKVGTHGYAKNAEPTSISLFDQGLTQILEALASGLEPKATYVLALSEKPDGSGPLQALSGFTTNPSGSAIVNAVGPIRQIVRETHATARRYLVIALGTPEHIGEVVQVQTETGRQ
jgi:hypothetical protein